MQTSRTIVFLLACFLFPPTPAAAQFAGQLNSQPGNSQSANPQSSVPYDPVVAACATSAKLNDLTLLSEDRLIAVGDRGLILLTDSGGRKWQSRESKTTASLTAVAHSSNTLLAVGGDIGTYTGKSIGVVLRSIDQGRSWIPATSENIPRLKGVSYQAGRWIAWGDYSPILKSSVFESADDGASWQPVACPLGHIAAGIASSAGQAFGQNFAAVDRLGNAIFNIGATLSVSLTTPQRPIHALAMTGRTWIAVGSEGLVQISSDAASWRTPQLPLSAEAAQLCTWNCIEQVGQQIWVGGQPGSILLHSTDAGQSWTIQKTGGHTPLRNVQFFDSARGWAINSLGGIIATRDGGQSWYHQRALAQRLGVLSISSTDADIPWQPLVASVWDDNVSVGSLSVTAVDAVLNADFHPGPDQLVKNAAQRTGLVFHSGLHNSGQTRESRMLRIAAEILAWRPDVVLVAPGNEHSSATQLDDTVRQTLEELKRPEMARVAQELGLSTWSAKKLVTVSTKRRQQYSESSHRVLSTVGLSVEDVLFAVPERFVAHDVAMRTIWSESSTPAANRSLLGGVPPSPDTRGSSRLSDVGNYQLVMGRVHRRKTLQALSVAARTHADDPSVAANWIQSLRTTMTAMPQRELAPSLVSLARELKSPSSWQQYEQALSLLIEKQPRCDAADWARLELLAAAESDELRAWSLSSSSGSTSQQQPVQLASATSQIPGLEFAVDSEPPQDDDSAAQKVWNGSPFGNLPNGSPVKPIAGAQVVSAAATRGLPVTAPKTADTIWVPPHERPLASWFPLSQAANNAAAIQLWPSGQLMSASVVERSQEISTASASGAMQSLVNKSQLLGWPQVAQQELLFKSGKARSLKWVANAATGADRPKLDGNLSDACWQTAMPIQLEEPFSPSQHALHTNVYLAADDDYLYLAISCMCDDDTMPQLATTRDYDSDLSNVDRIELLIDTDRDYSTSIHLGIGQDGRTFDSCAGSSAYNPRWFVAVAQQPRQWTAEIAMDLRDLSTHDITAGDAWALSLRRCGPNIQTQSWSQLRTNELLPHAAGLLLFGDPAVRLQQ